MYKSILQAMLASLFLVTATAQRNFPTRKLYPDPHRPGIPLDSSQIKLLQLRQNFTLKELTRIKDSIKNAQIPLLLYSYTPTLNNTSTLSASGSSTVLSNACGTKASFTPSNDTTLFTGQSITFTNTSQNADSYEWFNDVNNKTTTTDFTNFVPAVGVTQIMLVAHRGACTDTAVTYIINNGTAPADDKKMIATYGLPNTNEWASFITPARQDGYLLAGTSGIYDQTFIASPYFVRVSEAGCILWSRLMPSNSAVTVCAGVATYDLGFVVLVANRDIPDSSFLFKFDKDGNIVWSKSYLGPDALNFSLAIRELSDHSLMIMSTKFTGISGYSFLLANIDVSGSFRWQKKFFIENEYYAAFNDLVEKNGNAWVAGTYNQYSGSGTSRNQYTMLFKFDLPTGNLFWSKGYSTPDKYYTCSGIHFYKDGLILNGFADSLVNLANAEYSNFETLLETDLDGNIREGKLIYNTTQLNTPIGDNLFVNPDNSISLFYSGAQALALQPGYADHAYFLRLDANKNILWQNDYTGYMAGLLAHASPAASSNGLAMLGQRMNSLSNPNYGFAENLVLVKVDSNGKGPDLFCDVYETATTIQDMAISPWTPGPMTTTDQVLQMMNHPVAMINANTELRVNCPDFVPYCTFLKLTGQSSVCNLKDTLEFIAHRGPSCGDLVKWTYDVANIQTVYEDGYRTRLIFKTPGVYKILAEKTPGCAPISDSIIVTVAPTLTNFNLGGDTTLCTGDSITLWSPGIYSQYLWQDGSTDDSFKVKTAGQYYCMVTDSCGNTKTDTVHVDFSNSIPIDLGAVRYKCATDSLTITPPPGFKQYDWSPLYNLVSSANGSVILYPSMDTSYQLTVHDNSGCSGSASIKVNVYPGSLVNLGNDTSICAGGHAVFSAVGNFQSYSWSNGSAASSIDVQGAGNYSVMVTDQNGCKSSDSVQLTIYSTPAVDITGGTVLCKDQNLVLDAGPGYLDYRWQDGSSQEKFTVPDTGYYRVQVTDQHQCVSADSIHIAQYAAAPQGFLPSDTTVCLSRGGTLIPRGDFAQYNWSTGETSRSILVKTAGLFTLQVVDKQGCAGMDSVNVTTKDCQALLVFPNAFTPNNDGLNDVFRLKYPGDVADYHLQIFNRWGQLIFSSSDPFSGWDGRFENELEAAGTYVWIVRYTDREGKTQKVQGSVVLIR